MYITATDIQARMSATGYLNLFDRNGSGAVDTDFVATCIAEAQSRVDMKLGADFPKPLDTDGALVDEAIKGACVALSLRIAEMYGALSSGKPDSPYKALADNADAFLDALRKDDGARLKTAYGGRALPLATADNLTTQFGKPTNPFGRAADQRDPSGF